MIIVMIKNPADPAAESVTSALKYVNAIPRRKKPAEKLTRH